MQQSSPDGPDETPRWVGHWRVRRYAGEPPDVPTFYDASLQSWDVIKTEPSGLYEARHPILEVRGETILLKDEGEADKSAERWRAEVEDGRLRVTAITGPHGGAIGIAEPIDADPRTLATR
jgi:hypothetical protein